MLNIWMIILLSIIKKTSSVSYNQPKFCQNAIWNPNATTFANESTVGIQPWGVFVNTNNTVYVAGQYLGRVQVWFEGSQSPTTASFSDLPRPLSLFVTNNGDIYVDNGGNNRRVDKLSFNATQSIPVMYVDGYCFGLFVDINDNLYCCVGDYHQVIKTSLTNNTNTSTTVAGNGSQGSLSSMLSYPRGIFVDINLDLYVADCSNNRIQRFHSGQLNATTVAGNGMSEIITLNCPTGIVLDGDKYLFIVDWRNHRIVGSGPGGFRCLVGCSGIDGSASSQLNLPATLSFDSFGNMFVTDQVNGRIQKFLLATNSCSVSYNQPKFCSNAMWNPNAITFANQSTVGIVPWAIFVNTNNTVYLTIRPLGFGGVRVWLEGSQSPTTVNLSDVFDPHSLFVTNNGDIYVDNGYYQRVDKLSFNTTQSISVMNVNGRCYGLFVDINDSLYCSMIGYHQVIKTSLTSNTNTITTVAGTGSNGSLSNMLNTPHGIFVDINLDLYVADCANNRIQRFHSGQLNATTVAGNGISGNITLNCPTGIVLDGDKYLFIVDNKNNRIVGSRPDGFRCLVGCSGIDGSASSQLNLPTTLSFDSFGNMFVADAFNDRIQKFLLATNSCIETTTTDQMETSILEITTNDEKQKSTVKQEELSKYSTSIPEPSMTKEEEISTTTDRMQTSIFEITTNGEQKESTMKKEEEEEMFTTTYQMILTNQSCSLQEVKLLYKPSLTFPIKYNFNEEIFISSNIKTNCQQIFSIVNQWTIFNCTLNCSILNHFPSNIKTSSNEIYLPSKILTYGFYQLKLTTNLISSSNSTFSTSIHIEIIRSEKIFVNLIGSKTSLITIGQNQELLLDPEEYSFDQDGNKLIDYQYEYYCRIYDQNTIQPFLDISNGSCFSIELENTTKSSLKLLSSSFQSNRTYQFKVSVNDNRLNTFGYLFVQIEESFSYRITIDCLISSMCISIDEYQLINPTTQIFLYSSCSSNCSLNKTIQWNIYQGTIHLLTNLTQWSLFNQTILIFGIDTNYFTVSKELFLQNSLINYWKFEVIYSSENGKSSSSIHMMTNSPPSNGSCSINPSNGTITTLFQILCVNWFDENDIKDYLIYVWKNDYSKRMMIGFSLTPTFQIRLPNGNYQNSLLNIQIQIRDQFDSFKEFNISPVSVRDDSTEIQNLFNSFKDSKVDLSKNSFVHILLSGNQNDVGQIVISISEQFNEMNNDNLDHLISNRISISNISISRLGSKTFEPNSNSSNETILDEHNKQLNVYANIREYLINRTTNLIIAGSNSILLQSLALVQLTESTNQLTRLTSMIASDKCHELAISLNETSREIPFEDVQRAVNLLVQCTSNILNSINGPLQQRLNVLDIDFLRSNQSFDNNGLSEEISLKEWNEDQQKQMANQIMKQTNETISLLTLSLNNHLNIGQNFTINTSQVCMSFEKTSINLLSNKSIELIENAKINFSMNFSSNLNLNENKNILIRSKLDSLAPFGNYLSYTNWSRSLSLSILDENGTEISVKTNQNHLVELIIPRDPNLVLSKMILQNVVDHNQSFYYKSIHLNQLKPNQNLTISLHFQIKPLNKNVSYLFIYQFDQQIQLNQLDGSEVFCPFNLTNENLYEKFINNEQLSNHQSMVFGLRELTSIEFEEICLNNSTKKPSVINENSNFTSNYELRLYTSGCYYLDQHNNWQSDGLVVGRKTNLNQTQCFADHF